MDCSDFRTISLMSHVLKLTFRMILKRCMKKIDSEVSKNQSRYFSGTGTCEGMSNLCTIIDTYFEVHKSIYVCFIDYEKVFDQACHESITDYLNTIYMDD